MSSRRPVSILILLVLVCWCDAASASTWFVRKSGDDRRSGRKPQRAWATLRHAAKKVKPGDTVYVGAGAYLERIHFRRPKRGAGGSRPIRLVADTNGRMTGDRGTVYLLAPPRRWLLISDLKSPLHFEGFVFSSAAKNNPGYGLYGRGAAGSLVLTDCRFRFLRYGVYSLHARLDIKRTHFEKNESTAVLVRRGRVAIEDCVVTGSRKRGYALRLSRNTAGSVRKLRVTGQRFGVLAQKATRLDVVDSRFTSCSYGIYGTTRRGLIKSSTVTASRGGVYVKGIDEPVTISSATFDRCVYGLMVPESGYRAAKMKINNCHYAIWLARQVRSFRLAPTDRVQLTANQYGVYVSPKGSPRVELRGLDFTGTRHTGVLAYDAHLTVRDCYFNGSKRGIQAVRSRSLMVRNSKFDRMTNWGLVASGKKLAIRDSRFRQNANSIHLSPSAGESPELRRLTIERGGYGLYVQNSALRMRSSDAVVIRNNRYGLALRNVQSDLSGLQISGGQLPVYLVGGRHQLTNVSVSGSTRHGLLATKFSALSASGLKVTGCRNWGVHLRGRGIVLDGAEVTKNGNGLYVQVQDAGNEFTLRRSRIESNRSYGVLMVGSQIRTAGNLQLTVSRNGGIGLGAIASNVTLNGGMGVTISSNRYGVYANRADVDLTAVSLSDNQYGVRVIGGRLECRDCILSGGSTALSSTDSPIVRVTGGEISNTKSDGLSLSNRRVVKQQIHLAGVFIRQCRSGAYLRTKPDATIDVSDCRLTSNRSHGLISVNGRASVRDSTFAGNRRYGLLHYDGLLTVTGSQFEKNGSYGVRVLASKRPADSGLVAQRNTIRSNRYGVGAWKTSRTEIVNNLITGNRYGLLTRMASGQAELWNNTLADNHLGVHHSGGTARLANSIISYGDKSDRPQNVYGIYRTRGTLDNQHNLLFGQRLKYIGTKRGNGDVIKPPRFRDRAKGDYRLAMGSPAINAGTDSPLAATDLIGTKRPMYRAFEIGAYEFQESAGSVRILDWKEKPRSSSRSR